MTIKWLGQSGYLLQSGDTVICIDPYLSDVVNKVAGRPRTVAPPFEPENLKSDAVICTHNHLDHIDVDSIPRMSKDIIFYAPSDCETALKELGVEKYLPFDEGTNYKIGEFTITAVFAEHTVPAVGVVVECGKEKLYFSGDTYYNAKLEEIKCDLMFICINGKLGNMNVGEAVELAKKVKPITAIPNHYDMFESNSEDPHKFADHTDGGFIMEHNREYEVKDGCLI